MTPTIGEAATVTLAVDIGTHATVAAATVAGRRIPILANGRIEHPANGAKTMLTSATADTTPQAITALADHLRTVAHHTATQVGPPQRLILTAPASWGPRRHDLLRQAAHQAGLPTPTVIAEPVAAAAYAATQAPIRSGSCVLVCDVGDRITELSVVQSDGDDWRLLATHTAPTATGHALHQALTQTILDKATDAADLQPAIEAALPAAMATLSDHRPAALALPGQPPVVLNTDDLTTMTRTPRRDLSRALVSVIDAADINPDTLTTAVVLGPTASLLGADEIITARTGHTPITPADRQLALPYGALHLRAPTTTDTPDHPPTPGPPTLNWRTLRYRHLIPAALAMIAGPIILTIELDMLHHDAVTGITVDYAMLNVLYNATTFAAAGLITTLGTIASGTLFAIACHREDDINNTPGRHSRLAGRALAISAGLGIVMASLYGLIPDSIYGHIAGISPDFLGTAVGAAAIPATLAIGIGLLAPLLPTTRRTPWANQLHHPMTATLIAAAGIIAMSLHGDPGSDLWGTLGYGPLYQLMAILGPALLGFGTAMTLLNSKILRLVFGAILAIGYIIAYNGHSSRLLVLIYVITVVVWWIRQTALLAVPPGLVRRLVNAATTPVQIAQQPSAEPPLAAGRLQAGPPDQRNGDRPTSSVSS